MSDQDDVSTPAQIKAQLTENAQLRLNQAAADREAWFEDEQNPYDDAARAELVAAEPSLDEILPENLGSEMPGDALGGFDAAFEAARSQVMAQLGAGADQFVALMLQQAIDIIDDLREVSDEIAVEATQLGLAAASGLLVGPTREDLEDYRDEIVDAQGQSRYVAADLSNARARRRAKRTGAMAEIAAPTVTTPQPGLGQSFAAPGDDVENQAGNTSPAARQLQSILRSSTMNRINYIVLCTALSGLARSKASRTRAAAAAARLKSLMDQIKLVLSEGFLGVLQDSAQARANAFVDGLVTTLQQKLDAIDGFTQTIAGLPGALVSTVTAVGDISDTAPLLNSLSSLCGIKGQRFCDFQGLLQVAASVDAELGLNFPRLPMVGRVQLTLLVDGPDQVAEPVVVPGQEASLILEEPAQQGSRVVRARFAVDDRPSVSGVGTTSELAGYFGTGGGQLRLSSADTAAIDVVTYDSVSFEGGVYTFQLAAGLGRRHEPWLLATPDTAVLPGWGSSVSTPPGATSIACRMPSAQRASDVSLPCAVLLGNNESWVRTGTCRKTAGSFVTSDIKNAVGLRTFRAWHVGSTLNISGVDYEIISVIDGGDNGYDEAELDSTPPAFGNFRLSLSCSEPLDVTAIASTGQQTIFNLVLGDVTAKDHGRLLLTAERTVRVVPTAITSFLNPEIQPANGNVRSDPSVLPAGSTVVRAVFDDATQAAIFKPILMALGSGGLSLPSDPDLSWSSVVDEGSDTLRFTLSTPTTYPAATGDLVEVETTSMLDQFDIEFPSGWSDPIDMALRQILVVLNRIDGQLCRMMSGNNQDIAGNCAVTVATATGLSFALTGTRFLLLGWLTPLLIGNSLTSQLAALDAMGASRASQALREGRIDDFAAMKSSEATTAGAAEAQMEALRAKTRDENKFAAYAQASAVVAGEHQSVLTAGLIAGDIETAQQQDLAAREQGAQALKRLAGDITV